MIERLTTRVRQVASGFWPVALYGAALATLAFLLKWLQWRYLVADLSFEVYVGLVAVFFTALGVWVASKLAKPRAPASSGSFVVDQQRVERLGLTAREYEVLKLLAHGLSNADIGAKLFLSISTVKTHVSNVFLKLDVKSRTRAVVKARELGLVP